jgi:hypothetical protein
MAVQIPIKCSRRRDPKIAQRLRRPLDVARTSRLRMAALKEALVIPGHLPWLKWYFDAV